MTEFKIGDKRRETVKCGLRAHLAVSTALAALFMGGYGGRSAYAGSCVLGAPGTYLCSGSANTGSDLTQFLAVGGPLTVTTTSGFGIDTFFTGGNALELRGVFGLTFRDYSGYTIQGAVSGIEAHNIVDGAMRIYASGPVTGLTGAGILARSGGTTFFGGATFVGGTELTISAAAVSGTSGIDARSYGRGVLSITTSGQVTGTTGAGIDARNGSFISPDTPTDLVISAAAVNGVTYGIQAINRGSGAVNITTTGQVTGGGIGIKAYNLLSSSTDLIISTGSVSGSGPAISALNKGSGALDVTVSGLVNSTNSIGISAYGTVGTTSVATTSTSTVIGKSDGIYATNGGTGLMVSVSGNVTGQDSNGIHARNINSSVTSSMTITQAAGTTTTGGVHGINAENRGGSLTINAYGTSRGGALGDGIHAVNQATATGVAITANNAYGGVNGMYASNYGSGAMDITTSGKMRGTTGDGIFARNGSSTVAGGTDMMISAADARGAFGIYASNYGSGALSVTATGPVSGTSGAGIFAHNGGFGGAAGTDLTISTESVIGATYGIDGRNTGTGALKITTTGLVAGAGSFGIFGIKASNSFYGTDLIISAASVSGGIDGINASNFGSGALNVTTTGLVSGNSNTGINAYNNSSSATDLIISAASVSGSAIAISAINAGTGVLDITVSGQVTGTTSAIYAYGKVGAMAVKTTSTSTVVGSSDGIYAKNKGAGLMVSVSGDVTGQSGNGIDARGISPSLASSMTITQAAGTTTTGGVHGINADNQSGSVTINAYGTSRGGTLGDGIHALNRGATADIAITANDATGGKSGIYALNFGAGVTSVTVTGAVTGGTGSGIYTATGAGKVTNITLNSGAAVSSTSGPAISNDAGDSATTVNVGAGVTGEIRLGDGSDDLTFAGGDFSTVTKFDGGDDTGVADGFIDTLSFNGSSGVLNGADVLNWESLIITGGSAIGFATSALVVGDGTAGTGLSVNNGGSLVTNILSDINFDVLDVTGAVDFGLGAELDFNFDAGFVAADGLSLEFLTGDSQIGFDTNLAFNFIGLDSLFSANISKFELDSGFSLFLNITEVSAVPLPPSVFLFGSGLLGLAGLRRMRRRV